MNNIVKFSDNFMSEFDKMFNSMFIGDWDFPRDNKLTLTNYPPYNVYTKEIKSEDGKTSETHTIVEFALAGFKKDEIRITESNGTLTVKAENIAMDSDDIKYSHRGIGKRSFEWSRTISNNLKVNEASYEDGILKIELIPTKCDDCALIPIK